MSAVNAMSGIRRLRRLGAALWMVAFAPTALVSSLGLAVVSANVRVGDFASAGYFAVISITAAWSVWAISFTAIRRWLYASSRVRALARRTVRELPVADMPQAEARALLSVEFSLDRMFPARQGLSPKEVWRSRHLLARLTRRGLRDVVWLGEHFPAEAHLLGSRLVDLMQGWEVTRSTVTALGVSDEPLTSFFVDESGDDRERSRFVAHLLASAYLYGSPSDDAAKFVLAAVELDDAARTLLAKLAKSRVSRDFDAEFHMSLVRSLADTSSGEREVLEALSTSWEGGSEELVELARAI